ncbi:hypothetical protein H4R18_000406 [Coemansia javaensis]|uniref:N-acetyltransferase domain-containing protein n=1 Tax=Coemansia javaensis TaxID=2761396 RepID=A0A9W8LN59_9FUNG|nr:hypothetical protein H4R18_000406 [Coemansia javaensis]
MSMLEFRTVRSEDEVRAAHVHEAAGYAEDEAASLEAMLYRFRHAPHLFLGAFDARDGIVGYVMSTQGAGPLVTHESMARHDPGGRTVCIHSVCVSPAWQRRGVASRLLAEYALLVRAHNRSLEAAGAGPTLTRLAMLSRTSLVPLYERAGYTNLGRSSVVHGDEAWYDCVLDL